MNDNLKRQILLSPFENFTSFVQNYTGQQNPDYACIKMLETGIEGKRVFLLGINSALMAGRENSESKIDDYGKLIVGEPQIRKLFREMDENQITDEDLIIAILHHPFEWLREFDRRKVRMLLAEKCHFILCGHQHEPGFSQIQGIEGNYLIIPAGASYERRNYPNSYNFVHLDFESQEGKMYLRRWSNQNGTWIRDDETYHEGKYTFRLPTNTDNLRRLSPSMYSQLIEELMTQQKRMDVWKELHKKWQEFSCQLAIERRVLIDISNNL